MVETNLLDAEEYRRLSDYLYRHTGMVFTEARRYFVERRVEDRMIATGSSSFASYFSLLRANLEGELEQLINASTERNIWAMAYDRDNADVLKLEAEVAQAIASEINTQVTPEESKRLSSAKTVNPAAHDDELIIS